MRERTSLARQLMVWLTVAITGFWLIAVGFGIFVMQDEFGEIFDSSMEETAERLMPLVLSDVRETNGLPDLRPADPGGGTKEEYLTYQARGADGRVLLRSGSAPPTPFDAPLKPGFWQDDVRRIFTLVSPDGTVFLQVADYMVNRTEAAVEGGAALLLPVLLIVPLTVLAVLFIVRRTLAPIDGLRAAIGEKDGGNLAAIQERGLPRELKPILRSVNLLLSRLRDALAAERAFTSNSAHELRTPLAGALAQTQLLVDELKGMPGRQRAEQVEAALQKLVKLAGNLLQLARAESAGLGLAETVFDPAEVAALVAADFDRELEDPARLHFTNALPSPVRHRGTADAFAIVLRNLVKNALIHGAPDAPVELAVTAEGDIRIRNAGPCFSERELTALRKRFARGPTRAAGSGLGLAIADSLLAQMQARLMLVSPVPGRAGGLEARIVFSETPAGGA